VARGVFTAAAAITIALAVPAAMWAHAEIDELKQEAAARVAQHPDDPQMRLDNARVLQLAGEWDAAMLELDAAAACGGEKDEIDATRGKILLAAGRPAPALQQIDRVLARRADANGLRFERGRALLALSRTEDAAREFGLAIATMPQPAPEHVFARRDVLLSLGQREAALVALDEGMARIGRVATLQLAAIDIEVDLGRYDRALTRLDELIGREGINPAWIARRGDILQGAGHSAEARAEYARALALIETRQATQNGKAFDTLRRRLQTALASGPEGEKRQ
jgi:tetratricopeptide (TPR) repeat protein